jgi:hypothetical protein
MRILGENLSSQQLENNSVHSMETVDGAGSIKIHQSLQKNVLTPMMMKLVMKTAK